MLNIIGGNQILQSQSCIGIAQLSSQHHQAISQMHSYLKIVQSPVIEEEKERWIE